VPDPRVQALVREAILDANDDIPPVLHIWWQANSWYPGLAASERLALSEQALRQLLDEKLVVLIRNRTIENPGDEIPSDEYDSVLRRWDTWSTPPNGGVVVHYRRPDGVDYIPVPPPLD
jgi:hypothetical protein